jgi:hypothetical protein
VQHLVTGPDRVSVCEPVSAEAGIVTFAVTVPDASAVKVPSSTGVDRMTTVTCSPGWNPA